MVVRTTAQCVATYSPTYFHSFISVNPIVISSALIDASIRRLYAIEMKNSNPNRTVGVDVAGKFFNVHISVRVVRMPSAA